VIGDCRVEAVDAARRREDLRRPGPVEYTDYAVAAYKRIVMLEPGAPELDRLLDLLRERADVKTLNQRRHRAVDLARE